MNCFSTTQCLHLSFHYWTEAMYCVYRQTLVMPHTQRTALWSPVSPSTLTWILGIEPRLSRGVHGKHFTTEHLAGPKTAQLMWELRACLEIHAKLWKLALIFAVSLTRVMLVLQIFLWWKVEAEAANIRGLPVRKPWLVPVCYWSKE